MPKKKSKVFLDFTYIAGNQSTKLAMVALYLGQIHYMKRWNTQQSQSMIQIYI